MARRNTVKVVVAAVILGILAVVFCFAAYAKRIKVADVHIKSDGSCTYPSSPAFGLGIVAALFILAEQIVISVGTGCFCCRGKPCPSGCAAISSLILFIFSWVTFVIAFLGSIAAAILNNSSFLAVSYPANVNKGNTVDACYQLGSQAGFIGAAIWCIITIVLGLISFLILKASASTNENNQRSGAVFANEQGVAMGQPWVQLPKGQ